MRIHNLTLKCSAVSTLMYWGKEFMFMSWYVVKIAFRHMGKLR